MKRGSLAVRQQFSRSRFLSSHVSFPSLIEAFLHQVACRPDRAALIFETWDNALRTCSWRELSAIIGHCAADLSRRFQSNPSLPRRIGHASDNSFSDIVIALASMSIGAVEVSIDHRLSDAEIRQRWDRVGGLWVDQDLRKGLWSCNPHPNRPVVPTKIDVDAPSLILWTSGTTGKPQGVMLSQRNLVGNAAAKLLAVPQREDDTRLTVLPLSHAYARTCDFGTWLLSGCTLAVTLGHGGLARVAPRVRPTLVNTVPSLAYRWLECEPVELGLDRLRLLGCGGAAISETAFWQWSDRGVTVIQGYGLTESSPVICSSTPADASPGLVGRFVDGWESDLRDAQLYVRGPHTMLGYWDDELATAKKIDGDGWLATGDLVEQDEATGQLRILGRADDVIVLDSGRKIFPAAIECEVDQILGVRHAILLYRECLQLWFDAEDATRHDAIVSEIAQVMAKHLGPHDCGIHRFAPPLCEASGELTAKGTVRRNQVLENRFAVHAGS